MKILSQDMNAMHALHYGVLPFKEARSRKMSLVCFPRNWRHYAQWQSRKAAAAADSYLGFLSLPRSGEATFVSDDFASMEGLCSIHILRYYFSAIDNIIILQLHAQSRITRRETQKLALSLWVGLGLDLSIKSRAKMAKRLMPLDLYKDHAIPPNVGCVSCMKTLISFFLSLPPLFKFVQVTKYI